MIGGHLDSVGSVARGLAEPEGTAGAGAELVEQEGEAALAVHFEDVRPEGLAAVLGRQLIVADGEILLDRDDQRRRAEVGPVAVDHELRFLGAERRGQRQGRDEPDEGQSRPADTYKLEHETVP